MIDRKYAKMRERTDQRIQIGAVSYLNSKPLIEGFEEFASTARLRLDYPSRLADELARGNLDVALIPSVESFSDPDYEIVSDACVATHGDVLSVKLFSRVPPGDIQTLALDEGSRTSAALTQIMLEDRFGVRAEIQNLSLGSTLADTQADAVLLIGDRAMAPVQEDFHTIWDLGQEWVTWTGLPFVFAMWVARKSTPLGSVERQLAAARDLGVQRIEQIAQREAAPLGLSEETVVRYFTRNLHFELGSAERAGLHLFRQLAERYGFAPAGESHYRDFLPAREPHRPATAKR